MSETSEKVGVIPIELHTLLERIARLERTLHDAIEGDRQQLDVFIAQIKPELETIRRDVKWLKSQWEKFQK